MDAAKADSFTQGITFSQVGVRADFTNDGSQTALHLAAKNGKLEVVLALMRASVDKDARDKYGKTPLHLAVENGHTKAAKKLRNACYRSVVAKATIAATTSAILLGVATAVMADTFLLIPLVIAAACCAVAIVGLVAYVVLSYNLYKKNKVEPDSVLNKPEVGFTNSNSASVLHESFT